MQARLSALKRIGLAQFSRKIQLGVQVEGALAAASGTDGTWAVCDVMTDFRAQLSHNGPRAHRTNRAKPPFSWAHKQVGDVKRLITVLITDCYPFEHGGRTLAS